MGLQLEYTRRGEVINPEVFDNATQDGYNYIYIDLAEINGGLIIGDTNGVVFIETQLLAVGTNLSSPDVTAAGAMIRRATFFIDSTVPALRIARQEHDRIRGGSWGDMTVGTGSGPDYTTKPYHNEHQNATNLSFPVQVLVRDAAGTGTTAVAKNSTSGTVPDIAWPLRTLEYDVIGGVNGLTIIKIQWSIYKKIPNTYSVSWEVALKIYKP